VAKGNGLLHEACLQGYSRGVDKLIRKGANVNATHPITWVQKFPRKGLCSDDVSRNTPLHLACTSGSVASVAALLAAGANQEVNIILQNSNFKKLKIQSENDKGLIPAQLAQMAGYKDIAEILEIHKWDFAIWIRHHDAFTPL
jgi:ankyrin repeat protein